MSPGTRDIILDRVRAATRAVAQDPAQLAASYAALPRPYLHAGTRDAASRITLLVERLREYDAEVVECAPEKIAATIAAQVTASGRHKVLVPPELPAAWLQKDAFDWKRDHDLPAAEINNAEAVITAAFCAVADSGTIVLHHSFTEGRRVLTLLPDWHLCVLRASRVVETLPEYFARCPHPPPLITWISGPSATADIEMTRIKGVHGPRFLHVVLVRDDTQS